ncbi:isocitrate/isopropylmalate dehydrogenase family protein [Pseudomonas neustonica]|uniref:Isocitrate/isopropylmalate dehydrogenase family protein n=1 Tax=Pseudomonas neustonica TaxID=2487346 RepID=A0ABX9XLC6_9PSED|nr:MULTISPECIES: isocitrate/isopropylmalate family dehydrogenase [Pseudomonas]ROZ83470.1 isocitrate/isopropylmalate dehydrogenase family protein [Pseudomonas sp. SSM44]ROZ85328.1 isocitrate/isopropylmalate dehydrogenase family protein [Pseudomonas neustonica]
MKKLCVIPGDGIGPEVVPVAVEAIKLLVPDLEVVHAQAGWACFQQTGCAVPERTLDLMRECGAGLFGAVQSPAHQVAGYRSAILTLRQQLGLSVNLRPVRSWPFISPKSGIDLMVLRENSEGLYVGREHMASPDKAIAERHISRQASELLAQRTAQVAQLRQARRITLVHKANVLPLTCGLFRDSCRAVLEAQGLGSVLDERLVDVAALQLIEQPESFDLVVTTNLFGDVLSDLASYWSGGLATAPSLNWGQGIALAEPVHGSAPDIAGSGRANPIAALLSAALLLRYHWELDDQASRLEGAVDDFLKESKGVDLGAQTTLRVSAGVLERIK